MTAYTTCGCGRAYSKRDWKRLHLCGPQETVADDGRTAFMELRDCPCGNTMCGPLLDPARDWWELSEILGEACRPTHVEVGT